MQETRLSAEDLTSISGLGRSPGEGNATHSSILAWDMPWTEEPGGPTVRAVARVEQVLPMN